MSIPDDVTRAYPEYLDDEQKRGKADREDRPQDVKDCGQRKLAAREM
jgi:hypothetical protein